MPKRLSTWFVIMAVASVILASIRHLPAVQLLAVVGFVLSGPIWLRKFAHAAAASVLGQKHPGCDLVSVIVPTVVYGSGTFVIAMMISNVWWQQPTTAANLPMLGFGALLAAAFAGFVACVTTPQTEPIPLETIVFHPFFYQACLHAAVCVMAILCAGLYAAPVLLILPCVPVGVVGVGLWIYAQDDIQLRQKNSLNSRSIENGQPRAPNSPHSISS